MVAELANDNESGDYKGARTVGGRHACRCWKIIDRTFSFTNNVGYRIQRTIIDSQVVAGTVRDHISIKPKKATVIEHRLCFCISCLKYGSDPHQIS